MVSRVGQLEKNQEVVVFFVKSYGLATAETLLGQLCMYI